MKKISIFCAVLLAETVVLLTFLLSGGTPAKPLVEWSYDETGNFVAVESRLGEETVKLVNDAFSAFLAKDENTNKTFLPEVTASGEDVFVLTLQFVSKDENSVLHHEDTVEMWVTADENDAVTVSFRPVTAN